MVICSLLTCTGLYLPVAKFGLSLPVMLKGDNIQIKAGMPVIALIVEIQETISSFAI